jgi:hypothetical protein
MDRTTDSDVPVRFSPVKEGRKRDRLTGLIRVSFGRRAPQEKQSSWTGVVHETSRGSAALTDARVRMSKRIVAGLRESEEGRTEEGGIGLD